MSNEAWSEKDCRPLGCAQFGLWLRCSSVTAPLRGMLPPRASPQAKLGATKHQPFRRHNTRLDLQRRKGASSLDLGLFLSLLEAMTTNLLAQLSVKQLKHALAIREKIGTLEAQLGKILGAEPPSVAAPRRKRKLSAAAKAKISAAAKARWARFRASKGNK